MFTEVNAHLGYHESLRRGFTDPKIPP